jgi:hypothetical protein
VRQNHCSLDNVTQLPDISWPVVVLERSDSRGGESSLWTFRLLRRHIHEMPGELRDVIASLAKRSHFQRKNVESIIEGTPQVLPEWLQVRVTEPQSAAG